MRTYSTYLGGSLYDGGYGIAVDQAGQAYITGSTTSVNFPTLTGSYDQSHNGE
ncbi:MAG: SBBP repeat-containing protein, partial [Candidatus Binatia bacterium]